MPVEKVGDCYVWKCPYCDFHTKTYRRYETAVNQGIKHMVKMHEKKILMSGEVT
jgi:coproporphyrinogen III oxidase-like Fe-S oxidoreductase